MDTPWTAAPRAATVPGGADAVPEGRRIAVPYPRRDGSPPHELASQDLLASRLAALLGLAFVTDYDPSIRPSVGGVYYVPARTLGVAQASALGIGGSADLFGGVVPRPFVGTKAITHGLHGRARAPKGWSGDFARQVHQAVLRGYTVFTLADARRAGVALLREGPVRVKPVQATAGRGQSVVTDSGALDVALEALNREELAECGLVLEEHLEDVRTYSVGHVQVGSQSLSYVGTQESTRDNGGESVYGGSLLLCTRGGFDELLGLELDDTARRAVRLARRYDQAALACYPGLFASRRNYDVAEGRDAAGRLRAGVLEQSWRAGGASMAEVCALAAFQADPSLRWVRAYTRERYGAQASGEADGLIYHGLDTEVGLMSKHGGIAAYGHA